MESSPIPGIIRRNYVLSKSFCLVNPGPKGGKEITGEEISMPEALCLELINTEPSEEVSCAGKCHVENLSLSQRAACVEAVKIFPVCLSLFVDVIYIEAGQEMVTREMASIPCHLFPWFHL